MQAGPGLQGHFYKSEGIFTVNRDRKHCTKSVFIYIYMAGINCDIMTGDD